MKTPATDPITKERNYVAETTILTQIIEKENKNAVLYDKYNINPKRLAFVTEKPNAKPLEGSNAQTTDMDSRNLRELDDNLTKTIARFNDVPKNKQKYPVTNAQEIGWFHELKDVDPVMRYAKVRSKDTKFDESYVIAKGHSQFSYKARNV